MHKHKHQSAATLLIRALCPPSHAIADVASVGSWPSRDPSHLHKSIMLGHIGAWFFGGSVVCGCFGRGEIGVKLVAVGHLWFAVVNVVLTDVDHTFQFPTFFVREDAGGGCGLRDTNQK